ncbi:MAG: anti-sigma factor [Betaproteobacteria bacterium]|nr:anti-sigma factor [Betaproteobacteria bacterium]
MDCREARELFPAHVDRELGLPEAIEMDRHLHACPQCQEEFMEQSRVRAAVKKHVTYYHAPGDLAARIATALPAEDRTLASSRRREWRWSVSATWLGLGGALAGVVALVWSALLYQALPSADEMVGDQIVASHVRSLMASHIADVTSSDQHTVKPWFSGKLDFSPTVGDFTELGFPLVGGRLDYVDHRTVAALVYRHRQHLVNVYVWPSAVHDTGAVRTQSRQGYHLVNWAGGGMAYWVISDLNAKELMQLVDALRGQAPKAG